MTHLFCSSDDSRGPATALVAVLILCSFSSPAQTQPIEGGPPANIVFLVSDDHNFRALGVAGHPLLETPNLDRLAGEGVYFTHAFSPNPICMTSRAAILTGQDPWTNGTAVLGEPIDEEAPLWPRMLSSAGYQTFYTGKWHNDGRPATRGFTDGAAVWRGGEYDHEHLPVLRYNEDSNQREPADTYSSTLFVDEAIRFLAGRDTTRPFAMYVSFTVPHDPWTAPKQYRDMYDPRTIPLPPNFAARPTFEMHASFPTLRDQQQLPWPRPRWAVRAALGQYYGMITDMDQQIGRLLDQLDRIGLTQNTLVVFVGDQGYSMSSHGFVGKQTMYEEGIRTPLIIRYPEIQRVDTRDHHLVSLTDIAPTILEAADLEIPPAIEGTSLLGLYRGRDTWPRTKMFASFHSPDYHHLSTRAVRTERFKLIQHLLTGEVELFDLYSDPYELKNLANESEYTELRRRLTRQLEAWRSTHPEK